jgi:pimeloyl-ACP methyl ester carboxylesterase
VILYEDESGGLSWHFAEGALLTKEERAALQRRGLLRDSGGPEFVIPARSAEAMLSLTSGPPRGATRGIITKIGRKVLKILVIPVAGKVLEKPVRIIGEAIEPRVRENRVWRITPETLRTGPTSDFRDWKSLDGKRALLVVHGIFSSVEGMLSQLPASALARWSEFYEGRVIGFNHLSVTLSPEQNAKYFLELARQALLEGNCEFDVVCHSRGGIVSRAMAERGHTLVPETNCKFRSIYFVASPNAGSPLGNARHIVDMVDVFTNLLTQFPDSHLLYALESVLGVIKVLAYNSGQYFPGIVSMGTEGYITQVLNKARQPSPAIYAAAGSDYFPRAGVDNGFLTSRL